MQILLHWLLEEPLINRARLDVQDNTTPGLTHILCSNGNITLWHVVNATGLNLENAQTMASVLGQRSVCQIENILNMRCRRP